MAKYNHTNPVKGLSAQEAARNAGMMQQIKVFGVADSKHQNDLAAMLDAPEINCMGIVPPGSNNEGVDDSVNKAASMPVDVLVLMTPVFNEPFQVFMQEYGRNRRSVASVLIIDAEISIDLLQTAMLCGINNVVSTKRADKESICQAIRSEAEKNSSRGETADVRRYDSRVVLTYSSKGGAGKTTVAVNLAAALTQRGKKVCILDLDLASGDVHSFLGINNNESIAELAEEPQTITPAIIKSYVQKTQFDIGVMCAPAAPQHASVVQPSLVSKVITTLRSENDYVIIDCDQQLVNGSIAKCNDEAMRSADMILFIVTPEVPTICGAYEMISKYLNRFPDIINKIRLIVNKSGSASTITPQEIANTIGRPVFAAIPDDYGTVVQSLNTGAPFMSKSDTGRGAFLFRRPIMKAYAQLTDKVLELS